jgi:Ca2+/Na+ antiporter
VIEKLLSICVIIILLGLISTILFSTKDIKRSYAWLVVMIATLCESCLKLYQGNMISGIYLICISILDFFLFRRYYNKYKESNLENKEFITNKKLLDDLINKRGVYNNKWL